ncbi:MAG: ABC transporter ATP-binding protein [Firmicutes bacterium]|nr:ABC transporter ATP-binding protein [Bacillota bacterium]
MICVEKLKKTFSDVIALEDLSFTVKKSSLYGLIGHNGAGKTTLLKTIAGIYQADAGSVEVDGEDVFDNEQIKRKIFFIPDEHYFLPYATMNIMASFYKGFYPHWSDKTYKKLSEIFELAATKRIHSFSKGMQQQVAIILALATRPDYLLLDECFDGLDPIKRSLVRQLLTEMMADKEMSIVISSHNVRELEDLCDSIGVMNNKRIIYDSSLCEMREKVNKYRVAFKKAITADAFAELACKNITIDGRVATFIATGFSADIKKQLAPLEPALVQVIPLTLEEIFLSEMEEKDYDFKDII